MFTMYVYIYVCVFIFKHLSLKCYVYRLIDTCVSRKAVYEYVDTLDRLYMVARHHLIKAKDDMARLNADFLTRKKRIALGIFMIL